MIRIVLLCCPSTPYRYFVCTSKTNDCGTSRYRNNLIDIWNVIINFLSPLHGKWIFGLKLYFCCYYRYQQLQYKETPLLSRTVSTVHTFIFHIADLNHTTDSTRTFTDREWKEFPIRFPSTRQFGSALYRDDCERNRSRHLFSVSNLQSSSQSGFEFLTIYKQKI